MCGIVGYVGTKNAVPFLLQGLLRLEYRGYDSAGIGVLDDTETLRVHRSVGRVNDLRSVLPTDLSGTVGIGHTRWATHGPPTVPNAHPHSSRDGHVAVVHNGILDNANRLREMLRAEGTVLTSDTDTEVLAHLVARSAAASLEEAVIEALVLVEGTYGIAVLDARHPDRMVVARNGSPLIIGIGEGETYVASDLSAIVRHTSTVVHLEDGEIATVTAAGFTTFTANGPTVQRQPVDVDVVEDDFSLNGYEHYMRKEFLEQPESAARVLRGRLEDRFGTTRLNGLNLDPRAKREIARVKVIGCGSAFYVGQMGAQMIEELARIPADAEPASEFRYRDAVIEPTTLYVAVSQSGETADTAIAVDEIKRKGGRVVGVVNAVGSSIARACDGGIYLHAGPEVSVASTKALTNMALAFAMLAIDLGRVRDLSVSEGRRLIEGLRKIPDQIAQVLESEDRIAAVARHLSQATSLFFIGRVRGFPVAREGAQKFKEISYRHAEAYQSSELKHGPLALISPDVPTVAVVPHDDLTGRNLGALQEIDARGGQLVAVTHATVDFGDLVVERIDVPRNEPELDPILLTVPLQLLAYHAALHLGHDIDKPRNLAKSVTVE
ncbi:glutamine--fructose-6-phosphate transaminase (isomerizing) [Cellulosimicrobium cellulans]|uniref:glutamine--fructose-6-phosphate transaminase (isomerizing) n=1 Tax=Cellulosimicrobium cellulans TaxID=1710 RepID=UPI0020CFA1D1|nr:glutamine--fructose-6-phosphate transaminase (isomerizing) [Cellulosimicrobium cellulans]